MIFGVSGASGVGKSTVCKLVADSLDIAFVQTSITKAAKRHGYNAVGSLTLPERLDLQEKLLEDHIQLLDEVERPAILDRTPIDMLAYTLGEIYMTSHNELSPQQIHRVSALSIRCQWAAQRFYDCIFHLAPLPFYEASSTRPAENSAYQRHTDLIMRGALYDLSGKVNYAVLNTTDLNERQEHIHDMIVQRLDTLEAHRKSNRNFH